jgi:hypothetical protein
MFAMAAMRQVVLGISTFQKMSVSFWVEKSNLDTQR